MTADRTCSLCGCDLGIAEPSYPVRFDEEDRDVEVCVRCALYLAQQGVGAWRANERERSLRVQRMRNS